MKSEKLEKNKIKSFSKYKNIKIEVIPEIYKYGLK